jgi:hypothetical protein
MTGQEFQELILSTEIFKADENHLMVFLDSNKNPYNVKASWASFGTAWYEQIKINLYYSYDKEVCIDFATFKNLFASYTLEELSEITFLKELSKFLDSDKRFQNWKRDIIISDIIND